MKSIEENQDEGNQETAGKGDRRGAGRTRGQGVGGLGPENGRGRVTRHDSWVDAVVTLLATVVFGLGWALVELERADPAPNGYAAVASEMWVAAVVTSIQTRANDVGTLESLPTDRRREQDARWTELALQTSNR